jgi:hypothetical protein
MAAACYLRGMSGQAAVSGATLPRVVLVDGSKTHDVFEVIEMSDSVVRARSPFLFEIGEEMRVRVERDNTVVDAQARVRAHVELDGEKITELELSEQSEPRGVSG